MPGSYQSELDKEGIYYLNGSIDSSSTAEPIRWILAENLRSSQRSRLQLIINSTGGDLAAAFALIDIMRGSTVPIYTVGLGTIASAGLLIFIAGQAGKRILTPNTSILSHQWSWMARGKEHELISRTAEYELINQRIIKHFRRHTGLSKKRVRECLLPPGDVWLSAKQAKKLGLCDKIRIF